MNKNITLFIIGNPQDEHFTIVEHNNQYYSFYTDGYDGTKYGEVLSYLKFLGFEVFEVYKNKGTKIIQPVNTNYRVCI